MKLPERVFPQTLIINSLLLILFYSSSFAQIKSDYKIPFTLTAQNNIVIKAILNKKDTVSLMFHTAASSLTLTEEALSKMKSIRFERADTVKSWGGADNSSRYSKSNILQIGEKIWNNIPLWENVNSGQGTGGKFGPGLFEGKIIEINFDKNLLIVHSKLPSDIKTYERLSLIYKNEMMFAEASCKIGNERLNHLFLVHTGYSGAVLFDDQFTAEHKLDEKLTITGEKTLKDSFGNILKTKKFVISFLSLGKTELKNVPAGFFQGAIGRQKMSIIGGDLLKHFNIIISADRSTIFLKANRYVNSDYSNI